MPNVTAKIKEANEMMVDALEDAKLQYKKYKSLIDKVKNDYFSREADDLKADMQQLAPRVKYLARIVKDVMSEFNPSVAKIFWIFLIMNILHYKF